MRKLSGFIDESKDPKYIVACTFIDSHSADAARRVLRSLLLRGELRLHFKSERATRRAQLLSAMASLQTRSIIYVGNHRRHSDSRRAALETLIDDAIALNAERLVLETDDSTMAADRRIIASRLRSAPSTLRYEHLRAREEPLLWVSDAVAWCWQHRDWRPRVLPLVTQVRKV